MSKELSRLVYIIAFIFILYGLILGFYNGTQKEEKSQSIKNDFCCKIIALSDIGKPGEVKFNKLVGDVTSRTILFELLEFKKGNAEMEKKPIYMFPFPYGTIGDTSVPDRLRNLLEGRNKGEWFFYNQAEDEYNFIFFKIKYDEKSNNILISDIIKRKRASLDGIYFSGMGPDNNSILNCWGSFEVIEGKDPMPEFNQSQQAKFRQLLQGIPTGSAFLNKTDIVWQCAGNSQKQIGRFILLSNIILINYPEDKNIKILESGYSPAEPSYQENFMTPIGVSPTGEDIAFCALYPNEKGNDAELWLTIWKFDKNIVTKIVHLTSIDRNKKTYSLGCYEKFIKWCPVSEKNLIAVSSYHGIYILRP